MAENFDYNPFRNIERPEKSSSDYDYQKDNNNFSFIQVGLGNRIFRADQQGIWLGHQEWQNAPFRVDMFGRILARSAEFTGSVIKYNKTSFTDSVRAGYYISNEGIYFGSAGDASYLKYSVAGGTLTFNGILYTSSGVIGGFTITGSKLYANALGIIASDNGTYPKAYLDQNGITVNGAGMSINSSTGTLRGYLRGQDSGQGLLMFSDGNVSVQMGVSGGFSFQPAFNEVSFLGSNSLRWAGIYLKATTGNNLNAPTGVGGGSGTSGDADGTVGVHNHSLPAHSHTILFNYVEININGTDYKLLTA